MKDCKHESEGYCDKKEKFLNPQECDGCPMHEFTLHSATKYKDGTSIMSEPEKVSNQLDPEFCEFGTCPYYDKFCDHTLQDKHGCAYLPHDAAANLKYLEQVFTEFARTQDDLIAEYDETLKTHGGTLLEHEHKLSTLSEVVSINRGNIDSLYYDVEDLQRKVYAIYKFLNSVDPDFFVKIEDQMFLERVNNGSNFCGNCTHVNKCRAEDGIYACELSGKIIDPDESSCSMFEPPF